MTMTEHVQLNANNDLRKLHTLPKLIFETVKVVVSNVIEYATDARRPKRNYAQVVRGRCKTTLPIPWSGAGGVQLA